ncbi:DUF2357 domain-containing protein [Paenibacillus sp. y28]|uniref:DUF2357 domain-containing protein n=1 Tax=Paenibacillus sp. y28 TaxID=3129110 RepID=UPI003019F9F2
MEQPSSGDSLLVWCPDQGQWLDLEEVRLEEAKTYRWRTGYERPFRFSLNGVPLPMVKSADGWEGELFTPFQSGQVRFTLHREEERIVDSYLYPDARKLTENDYQQMIIDILQEAKACFQQYGAALAFDTSGIDRQLSMPQWDYVERMFHRLSFLYREIQAGPLRVLTGKDQWVRRENVKHVTPALIAWAERHPGGGTSGESLIPAQIWTGLRTETCDVYENRIVHRQLRDFLSLLRRYAGLSDDAIRAKASRYADTVARWLRAPFLAGVKPHPGTVAVSQAFRKHPIYRGWFQWFQQLYQFDAFVVGLRSSVPLKNTYQLYEIWVFMKLVGFFRERDLIEEASPLFVLEQKELVLSLSQKKEHRIRLKQGGTLAYQREFTSATRPFATYTHGMLPDIVLEIGDRLVIFDPKYRLDHNLPMAVGEMHKYRDGIIRHADGAKAVEEVYIITPVPGKDNPRFFEENYREKHRLGAYCLNPGTAGDALRGCLERIVRQNLAACAPG